MICLSYPHSPLVNSHAFPFQRIQIPNIVCQCHCLSWLISTYLSVNIPHFFAEFSMWNCRGLQLVTRQSLGGSTLDTPKIGWFILTKNTPNIFCGPMDHIIPVNLSGTQEVHGVLKSQMLGWRIFFWTSTGNDGFTMFYWRLMIFCCYQDDV